MILRIFDIKTGLFLRDDFTFDEQTEIGLNMTIPDGFYLPKWDGKQVIEGLTQEQIDAIKSNNTTEPTLEDRVATTETEVVTIQETLDVLFGGV